MGCRLLQQKLDECPDRPPEGDAGGEPSEDDAVSAIFMEALPNLSMMMIDPFGNYLFQKLFVKVDDHQRLLAVSAVQKTFARQDDKTNGSRKICILPPDVSRPRRCCLLAGEGGGGGLARVL